MLTAGCKYKGESKHELLEAGTDNRGAVERNATWARADFARAAKIIGVVGVSQSILIFSGMPAVS